ncbi:hypothetical protein IEQ34_004338 [Dendrobium chrysotoxum]|uniref:Uncharacterized protein n=1 Tax=Dendrobium chrysotoxum TaxID=161865 RepID=A0AAV7GZ94_DENCH|nr:hypothetical protein IEQ34_004338 [Dendrobium chrysotoxum]
MILTGLRPCQGSIWASKIIPYLRKYKGYWSMVIGEITLVKVAKNLTLKMIIDVIVSVKVCLKDLIQDLMVSKLKSTKGKVEIMETDKNN